jgi:L-cysteine:1D-myo-inositol 2-amino-2-deoxy-alpha-D-glucopyranoside ligase
VRLFNTLTGDKEKLTVEGDVRLYVCGVTPYDTTHVGHARTYLVFDVLVRHLLHQGLRVNYIQNITDVDESILKRARELEQPYDELGDRYTAIFLEDLAELGLIPATHYPRATDVIPEIQEVIGRLLDGGQAYRVDGDVYFDVSSTQTFGELSRLPRADMLDLEAQQDGSTIADPRKRDPLDFPLWRSAGDGEVSWASPWGRGRPGWHIECSTLALKHLGRQVDIHGGGSDLVFPHHEAEIAQSEAVTGVRPFVRFWVHVGMARLGGEKMAKSRGNVVFVRDLLTSYAPDALRLYLLRTHYRAPLDFDEGALGESAALAVRLARAARAPVRAPRPASSASSSPGRTRQSFIAALDDDIDTPSGIALLDDLAAAVLSDEPGAYAMQRELRRLAARLGLSLEAS